MGRQEQAGQTPLLEEIKEYYYRQFQWNRVNDPIDVEARKIITRGYLEELGTSMWFGDNSEQPRADIYFTEAGYCLVPPHAKGLRDITRFISGEEIERTEDRARNFKWAVTMTPRVVRPVTIFEDSETERIGIHRMNGWVQVFDFRDENWTLAELESYLGRIFYPGSNPRNYELTSTYFTQTSVAETEIPNLDVPK